MDKVYLTMQDISCVGQCSMTVAHPILSSFGLETAMLPTAVLSNHTMFPEWSYLDVTPETGKIFDSWERNGFSFSGFLLGYLGKSELMDAAEECFDRFARHGAEIVIDPVMGDMGKLYGGFDEQYVDRMRKLVRRADVILPNLTEACFLTGAAYRESYDEDYVEDVMERLSSLTEGAVVLTGVERDGMIGEAYRSRGDATRYVFAEKLPARYHGTGDIFSAVFAAGLFNGRDVGACCAEAGKFVADCIRATPEGHGYGVCFEKVLSGTDGALR